MCFADWHPPCYLLWSNSQNTPALHMKKLPTTLKLAFALGFTCVAISLRAQNIVADPGFEASADGLGAHPFSGSWTVVDPSGNQPPGVPGSFSNVGGDTADAHSGANYANLGAFQTIGTLSQTLATTAGRSYTFSFWLANNVGSPPPNSFQAFFGGSMVFATTAPPFVSSGSYAFESFTTIATSSSTLLQFQYRNDGDFWRLDDISVVVPEGGAPLWLAIPVFGGLCLLHSRLQRRQVARS